MATLPAYVYEVQEVDATGRLRCERSAPTPMVIQVEAGDPPTAEAAEAALLAMHAGRIVVRSAPHFNNVDPGALIVLVAEE